MMELKWFQHRAAVSAYLEVASRVQLAVTWVADNCVAELLQLAVANLVAVAMASFALAAKHAAGWALERVDLAVD
jgi:hypothetical protein